MLTIVFSVLLPILAIGRRHRIALENQTDAVNRSESTCFDPITATWCAGAAGTVFIGALVGQMEGDGFRCCCDSDVRPEAETLCRYITPKKNGKCPRANLGRGWTQTHSAKRNHGVLSTDKCILTGEEEIPPLPASVERMQCGAQEDMDAKMFPPEETGHWAIRMAFGQIPSIGRLFFGIEEIQVAEIDMTIKLKRKSDASFSFEIAGPGGRGDAIAKVWLQGIHFQLPESSADAIVKTVAQLENIGGNILTLGMVGKNYGKVSVSPADVKFHMKADFQVSETGEWGIVPDSESQFADVNIGSGGMLMGMVNLLIKHLGGMDQIFFDNVWPLVKQIFPASLGKAFQEVPLADGDMEHNLKVSGRCNWQGKSGDGESCPSHLLTIDIKDSTFVRFRPRQITDSLLRQDFYTNGSFLQAMAENTMKAYEEGRNVFEGTAVKGHIGFKVTSKSGLVVTGTPTVELPYSALSTIIGPGVNLENFIGRADELKATGSIEIQEGVLSVKDLGFRGLALPVGEAGQIEISATLDDLNVVVEEDEASESDLIFKKDSPLFVRSPGIDFSLGLSKGLTLKPEMNLEGTGVKVAVDPTYLKEVFQNATKSMMMPTSVRTAPQSKADGVVPDRFTRPHAFMREPLDLTTLMHDIDINTELVIEERFSHEHGLELMDVNLDFTATGDLSLTGNLWRGLINNKDKDSGYLHVSLPGYYGEFKDEKFSGTPALATLSCGSLWLHRVDIAPVSSRKPFADVIVALDVGDKDARDLLSHEKSTDDFSCLQVETDSVFIGLGTVRKYFCTKEDEYTVLKHALNLQNVRMRDSNERWPNACAPGPNGSPPSCMGNPDGTWFTSFNPLDVTTWFPARMPPKSVDEVKSPRDQWASAVNELREWGVDL